MGYFSRGRRIITKEGVLVRCCTSQGLSDVPSTSLYDVAHAPKQRDQVLILLLTAGEQPLSRLK